MTQAQAEDTRVDWEAALVQRACTGDTRAFERLYREHAGRVYGLCLRMPRDARSEEHTSEIQSQSNLVCRLLLDKKMQLGGGTALVTIRGARSKCASSLA